MAKGRVGLRRASLGHPVFIERLEERHPDAAAGANPRSQLAHRRLAALAPVRLDELQGAFELRLPPRRVGHQRAKLSGSAFGSEELPERCQCQ